MSNVAKVRVGSTVTELEDGLFQGMTTLREVDFSNSPSSLQVPKRCFKECTSLQRCIFPGAEDIDEDQQDIRLDYIIGNGACVDTGYVPNMKTILSFEVQQRGEDYYVESDALWIGAYNNSSNRIGFQFTCRKLTNGSEYWYFGNKTIAWGNLQKHQWMIGKGENNKLTSNMQNIIGSQATSLNMNGQTVKIFGIPKYPIDFKIRYLRIYESAVTNKIMELVPVVSADKEVCFLDLVSGRHFGSVNDKKMIGIL